MTLSISIPKIWPGINGVTRIAASAVGPLCGERDRQREREREREREMERVEACHYWSIQDMDYTTKHLVAKVFSKLKLLIYTEATQKPEFLFMLQLSR